MPTPCFCNSSQLFEYCCQPIILGKRIAETAEQLMRSRYSAFVVANINYLMNTHHPSTRPSKEKKSILKWARSVKWMGLEILHTKQGQADDNEGFVEFKASFIEDGTLANIHENSFFVKENGKWYYKSGIHQ